MVHSRHGGFHDGGGPHGGAHVLTHKPADVTTARPIAVQAEETCPDDITAVEPLKQQ